MPRVESSPWAPPIFGRAALFCLTVVLGVCLPLGLLAAGPPPGPPPGDPPPPLPPEILAQQPTAPPPGLPNVAELREELSLLYEFLSASPDKLARMRRLIDMVEGMTPENREFIRLRLVQLHENAPELQAEIEAHSNGLSPQERRLAVRYWLSLRGEERDKARARLDTLSEVDRLAYIRQQIEAFEAAQQALRKSIMGSGENPPSFIPPPPPVLERPGDE